MLTNIAIFIVMLTRTLLAPEVADDRTERDDDALIAIAHAARFAATSVRVLRQADDKPAGSYPPAQGRPHSAR